jgi:hypothetical protein
LRHGIFLMAGLKLLNPSQPLTRASVDQQVSLCTPRRDRLSTVSDGALSGRRFRRGIVWEQLTSAPRVAMFDRSYLTAGARRWVADLLNPGDMRHE